MRRQTFQQTLISLLPLVAWLILDVVVLWPILENHLSVSLQTVILSTGAVLFMLLGLFITNLLATKSGGKKLPERGSMPAKHATATAPGATPSPMDLSTSWKPAPAPGTHSSDLEEKASYLYTSVRNLTQLGKEIFRCSSLREVGKIILDNLMNNLDLQGAGLLLYNRKEHLYFFIEKNSILPANLPVYQEFFEKGYQIFGEKSKFTFIVDLAGSEDDDFSGLRERISGPLQVIISSIVNLDEDILGILLLESPRVLNHIEHEITAVVEFTGQMLSYFIEKAHLNVLIEKMGKFDVLRSPLADEHFQSRLQEEIQRASRYSHPLSMMITEVSGVDILRKELPEETVEKMLSTFGDILLTNLRASDIVMKSHPNRYVVCLPETKKLESTLVAQRIRNDVHTRVVRKYSYADRELSFSCGIACYPDDSPDPEGLLQKLNTAFKKSRLQGKNYIAYYSK